MSLAERYAADDPELARLLANELVALYDLLERALPLALRGLTAQTGIVPVPLDLFDQLTFWAQLLTVDRLVFPRDRALEEWIGDQPSQKPSPLLLRRATLLELSRALGEPRTGATVGTAG